MFNQFFIDRFIGSIVLETSGLEKLGSNPFRAQQEKARAFTGLFGMTFTDRNAFGAIAMPERAHPQRPGEDVWNAEYSRQGLIFDFADTREQCRTMQPFCIKAYRRLTAAGDVILLKQVIASIHVKGRHWGILQMAYQDQG